MVTLTKIPCQFSMEVMDLYPPLTCLNLTQCENKWPCEVREYWISIHPFVDITRLFLLYGTITICIVGVFLNCLSFYVLISSGLAKNASGIYLMALAVCDTGNLIFNYALGVSRVELALFNQYFVDSEWLCRSHGVFVDVFQLISAWIVVSFTIERCTVVWFPLILRQSRKYRSKIVIIVLCTCLSVLSASKFFLIGFEKDSVFGYAPCPTERLVWPAIAYVRVAFQTWIPTLLVFVFNCLMFWKLRRIKSNRERLTGYVEPSKLRMKRCIEQNKARIAKRTNPTTPMLIAVSLAYLVLVFPLGVVQTVELYWHVQRKVSESTLEPQRTQYIEWMISKLLLKYLRSFCFGFYQFNFAINFFLYCAAGVQFRTHLQSSLCNISDKVKLMWCRLRIKCCCQHSMTTANINKNICIEL